MPLSAAKIDEARGTPNPADGGDRLDGLVEGGEDEGMGAAAADDDDLSIPAPDGPQAEEAEHWVLSLRWELFMIGLGPSPRSRPFAFAESPPPRACRARRAAPQRWCCSRWSPRC